MGDLQVLASRPARNTLLPNPQNINSLIQAEMKTMQDNLKELK